MCGYFSDEVETVMHSDDAFAPVGYLNIKRAHLQDKDEVWLLANLTTTC